MKTGRFSEFWRKAVAADWCQAINNRQVVSRAICGHLNISPGKAYADDPILRWPGGAILGPGATAFLMRQHRPEARS